MELVPIHYLQTSNVSLLGLSNNQATLELGNIPEEDVDEQQPTLEEDKLTVPVFCFWSF